VLGILIPAMIVLYGVRSMLNRQAMIPSRGGLAQIIGLPAAAAGFAYALLGVTVRLKPEIAAALKRASLERQLAGEEIYTQQDLVELALEPWLKAEGHL
jgi:hypothetical protein